MTDKQKKTLGIGGIGVAGLLVYSHLRGGSKTTATPVTNPSATGSVTPYTPQSPLTLQPGESVYDPNSENLLTTPTPIDTTGSVPGNGNQTVAPSQPAYSVNVNYPAAATTTSNAKKPAIRKVGSPAGPHGAIVAPSGKKPPNKPGYITIGTGRGGWIYKPIKA